MDETTSIARQVCEDFLRERIRKNNEWEAPPSLNRVAERLLARGDELAGVYDEIYPRLYRNGICWKTVLGCLMSIGTFWSPENIAGYRADRDALVDLNRNIAKRAKALADLLAQREDQHNHSGFSSDPHCDILTSSTKPARATGATSIT